MQEFADIIRDTGPVPKVESVETSVANSKAPSAYNTDDEASNQAPNIADKSAKEETDKGGVKHDLKKLEKHEDKDIKQKEDDDSKPSKGDQSVKKELSPTESSENDKETADPKPSNGEQGVKKESSPTKSSENGKESSRPKHSIANLIGDDVKTPSKEEAPKKRDLEEKQSPLDGKKMKEDPSKGPSKEHSDPPVFVSGSGSGRENESAPIPGDEIIEEAVFFFGVGLGAECCTGNTATENGNGNSNEVERKENGESTSAEKDSKVGKTAKSKDVPAKAKDTPAKADKEKNGSDEEEESKLEGDEKATLPVESKKGNKCDGVDDNGEENITEEKREKEKRKSSGDEDESGKTVKSKGGLAKAKDMPTKTNKEEIGIDEEDEEENKSVSRRSKRKKEEEKAPRGREDSDEETDSKAKRRKGHSRKKGDKKGSKDDDGEDDDKPLLRRSSGRIQALRIMEADRRQKDEERALEDYKVCKREFLLAYLLLLGPSRILHLELWLCPTLNEYNNRRSKRGRARERRSGWPSTDDWV